MKTPIRINYYYWTFVAGVVGATFFPSQNLLVLESSGFNFNEFSFSLSRDMI